VRIAALLVAAAALAAAPAAWAKEVAQVRVCGLDGCMTTQDTGVMAAVTNGGPTAAPPRRGSGVISLRATVVEPDGTEVPGTRRLAAEDGSWMRLTPQSVHALERVAGHFEPFPAGDPGRLLIAVPVAGLVAAALLAFRHLR
jgi:hypothetical protein